MMQTKFSMRDRKDDILKAYEELVEKYKERDQLAKMAEKEIQAQKSTEQEIVKKASSVTVDDIVKDLANIKLDIGKVLGNLSDQLATEANKLSEIQQAIKIEEKNLEEIYDIKIVAETMNLLIQQHTKNKKEFEEEIANLKIQSEREQTQHDEAVKERDIKLKKEREREVEEYQYALNQKRKKEKDAYEEEKTAQTKALKEEREKQERELAERETVVAEKEKEWAELKTKVESFPTEIEKVVEKTRKETSEFTEKEATYKAELLAKEYEGAKKVAELNIKNLETTVAKQTAEIQALNKQLVNATTKVEDIAVKAIEGASGVKALSAVNEIALEQAKNIRAKKE